MLGLDKNPDYKRLNESYETNPYYDLDGSFEKTEIFGFDALDQAIEMVLATEPGERMFNPKFGSPIYAMLFENMTDIESMMGTVYDTIEFWVPITIYRSQTDVKADNDEHSISFKIPYISNDGKFKGCFSRVIGL